MHPTIRPREGQKPATFYGAPDHSTRRRTQTSHIQRKILYVSTMPRPRQVDSYGLCRQLLYVVPYQYVKMGYTGVSYTCTRRIHKYEVNAYHIDIAHISDRCVPGTSQKPATVFEFSHNRVNPFNPYPFSTQSRFGDKILRTRVVCPQNGPVVLKGLKTDPQFRGQTTWKKCVGGKK